MRRAQVHRKKIHHGEQREHKEKYQEKCKTGTQENRKKQTEKELSNNASFFLLLSFPVFFFVFSVVNLFSRYFRGAGWGRPGWTVRKR